MNSVIIDQFKLLIKQIKIEINTSGGKKKITNMYRLSSVINALNAIEKISYKIANSNDLKNIKGIGNGTLNRVDEILKTGKLSEINIPQNYELIEELENIYGIGKKKAYELFSKYNIKNIEDLKNKAKSIDLPENIKKGLKYYGKINEKINREIIDDISIIISKLLLSIDNNLLGIICGSYRRLKLVCSDIDIIIVHPKYMTKQDTENNNIIYNIITKLKENNYIEISLTDENVNTKYMGIFKWKDDLIRIDIRFMPYQSYYSAILYFTGSKNFNKKMRTVAITMGYTLNEYGLFDKNNKIIKVSSEKDIFDKLNMEYLSPESRI